MKRVVCELKYKCSTVQKADMSRRLKLSPLCKRLYQNITYACNFKAIVTKLLSATTALYWCLYIVNVIYIHRYHDQNIFEEWAMMKFILCL